MRGLIGCKQIKPNYWESSGKDSDSVSFLVLKRGTIDTCPQKSGYLLVIISRACGIVGIVAGHGVALVIYVVSCLVEVRFKLLEVSHSNQKDKMFLQHLNTDASSRR